MPNKINEVIKLTLYCLFLSIISLELRAQIPNTDIYLGDYHFENGKFEILHLRNFTNREGYDNQPFFIEGKPSLLYVSVRNDSQSDIYRYDWDDNKINRVTETQESEYSPKLRPQSGEISVVRVDSGGIQHFRSFDLRNPGSVDLYSKSIENIGYYEWLSKDEAVMFRVEKSGYHSFDYLKIGGEAIRVDSMIGRSLLKHPEFHGALYVSKRDSANWKLMTFNAETIESSILTDALNREEDYCILDIHYILAGSGTKLFAHTLDAKNKDWVQIQDIANFIEGSIERIILDQEYNKIAIVVKK